MVVTKVNLAGKIVVTSKDFLSSMMHNPRPTRAEMTDVSNAIFYGSDALMLVEETAVGEFGTDCIATMHSLICDAEQATTYYSIHTFVQDMSAKPFNSLEAAAASTAKACVDSAVSICIVISFKGIAADFVAKYRPAVLQIAVTNSKLVAGQSVLNFGVRPCFIEGCQNMATSEIIDRVLVWAKEKALYSQGPIAVLHGLKSPDADESQCL